MAASIRARSWRSRSYRRRQSAPGWGRSSRTQTWNSAITAVGRPAASKEFHDVQRRPEVALVVDDLAAFDPWTPRGIEIRGDAETHSAGGEEVGRRADASFRFSPAWIGIRPRRILAWGIDTDSLDLNARDVA